MRTSGPEGHSDTLNRWPLAQPGLIARSLWLPEPGEKNGDKDVQASALGSSPVCPWPTVSLTMNNQTDLFSFGRMNEAPKEKSTLAELGSSLPIQMTSMANL